jgi:hypothetical protein
LNTLAEITIIPSMTKTSPVDRNGVTMASVQFISGGEPVVLSNVNFGLHNAVRTVGPNGFLLRIDKSAVGKGVLSPIATK